MDKKTMVDGQGQRIAKPFGELARQITIKSDTSGYIIVEAFQMVPQVPSMANRGFRPGMVPMVKKPIDAREMVLALIKVVQDYTSVLFATMGEGVINHGETNQNNNDNQGSTG